MTGQKEHKRKIVIDFNRFFSRNWHYLVVLVFGAILSVGVWSMVTQIMTGDDYAFHVMRLQSASKAWSNGQLVPQIDPDALGGFGYAYNLFYGPLAAYVAAGLQALIGFWPVAINLVLLICLMGSGLTMCYAMTKISKNKVLAALVAVFYMAAPYTLNNLYARMALGEVVAAVAAPILLLGLYQLTTKQKHAARSIALAAALLVLSHSLSAMLMALMAAIYVLLNWRKVINWENIWRMVLGVGVALGLTAFFTLPLLEAKLVDNYGVFDAGYSDVYFGANPRSMNDHRLWPQQLVVMDYTGKVNAEGLGGEFGVTLGIIALVGLIGFWFVRKKIEDEGQRRFVTSLYLIAVIAILVALPVVNWYQMPGIMWQMQFPWRSLMISTLALAVVSGYTICGLMRGLAEEKQKIAAVLVGVMAVYFVMPLILPRADRHIDMEMVQADPVVLGWEAEYAPMQLLCSAEVEEDVAQGYACSLARIRELLEERGAEIRVLSGGIVLEQAKKDGLNVEMRVENPTNDAAVLELPMIYYPGYQAKMGDTELAVGYSQDYGMVTVTVPAGAKGTVQVYYGVSLATQIGATVSVATAGLGVVWVIISGIIDRRRRKKEAEMTRLMDSVREVVEDDLLEEEFTKEAEEADKAAIIASLGEPDLPAMPNIPVPQPPAIIAPAAEVVAEPAKPKRTCTTKAKTTGTAKATRATKKASLDADAEQSETKKATTRRKTTRAKKSAETKAEAAPRRTTTTRVRTVKSDEGEE